MKKVLGIMTTVIITTILLTGVAYANDWLNFDSEEKADQTQDNIDELMEIAIEFKEGKISADDAVADLSDKLLKSQAEIEDLKEQIKNNTGDKEKIQKLNAEIVTLKDKITGLNDKIRNLEENQGNNKVLKEERDHYKKELERANKATNKTLEKSEKALEKVKK